MWQRPAARSAASGHQPTLATAQNTVATLVLRHSSTAHFALGYAEHDGEILAPSAATSNVSLLSSDAAKLGSDEMGSDEMGSDEMGWEYVWCGLSHA